MGEHRKDERKSLGYPATILVNAATIQPCMMMDVSENGARLIVVNAHEMPDHFTLFLSKMGARRQCHVMWRRPRELGVQFDLPPKQK